MKIINRFEAKKLRESGYGNYVKMSHSNSKKYYAVEDPRILKFLNDLRIATTK